MENSQENDPIINALVEALNVDAEEIRPEHKIKADLGMESIDILDIRFRIERSVGIKITRDEKQVLLDQPDLTVAGLRKFIDEKKSRTE